jgi:hypothetical protein
MIGLVCGIVPASSVYVVCLVLEPAAYVKSFAPLAGIPFMNWALFPIGLNFAIYIPLGNKKPPIKVACMCSKLWYCYEMEINPIALGGIIVFLIIALLNRR